MSDPFVPRRKIYRKRRKSEGASWSPDTELIEKAKADKGPICKSCRKVRRWGKLTIKYEVIGGVMRRVWFCDQCGDQVRVDEVGSDYPPLTESQSPNSMNAIKTEPMPGGTESVSDEPLSAKQAAIECGTDARTLRKFLRSKSSPFEPVGQGSRYTFDKKEMKKLKKAFISWSDRNGSTRQEIQKAEPKVDHIEDEEMEELEDFDEPTDDDLDELEELELDKDLDS